MKTFHILQRAIHIPIPHATLEGDLTIPHAAAGIIVFAHGSGSSRRSPRNRYVAGELHEAGLATLLFDLLTRAEEEMDARTAHLRFDVGLLSARLEAATDWLQTQKDTRDLLAGYFGASTGAAAALCQSSSPVLELKTPVVRLSKSVTSCWFATAACTIVFWKSIASPLAALSAWPISAPRDAAVSPDW